MDLFLDKEVLLYYFNNLFNPSRDEIKVTIERMLNNPKNRFLISESIIDCIESSLNSDELIIDYFHGFVKSTIDGSIINLENYNNRDKRNYNDEFRSLISSYHGTFISCIFLNPETTVQVEIPFSILSKISKPNLSWIIRELASNNNGLSVRYFDFKTDNEIKTFFKDIFHLPLCIDEVYIFDRQCNLNHDRFDELIKRKPNLKYFTARENSFAEDLVNKRTVTNKFGPSSELYVSRRENIHERRIIIGSIIIDSDDDFYNILCERRTWKIDVICCNDTASKHLNKMSLFQKMLN